MIKLENEVIRGGFKYVLLKRSLKAAIYIQYLNNTAIPIMFEVFKIKVTKSNKLPSGLYTEDHETFPSKSSFGKWAWTYKKIDDTMNKFKELNKG